MKKSPRTTVMSFREHSRPGVLVFAGLLAGIVSGFAQTPVIPEGSAMAGATGQQRLLLNPLDGGGVLNAGKWRLKTASAEVYPGIEPKVGAVALKFKGDSEIAGGKGDFAVVANPPGELDWLGAWVYLAAESNVKELGFQVYDKDGEAMISVVPADWQGWKWVEMSLKDGGFRQAYKQDDKNKQMDFPLKAVNFVWFTQNSGPTFLGVDALAAVGKASTDGPPYSVNLIGPAWGEPGQPFQGQLLVNNFTDQPVELDVRSVLQQNPQLYDKPLPDPILGSDHAQGRPSWLTIDGERVEDNALTDDDDDTSYQISRKEHYLEAFQFVDLGQERKITALGYRAGDANWIHKVDIDASLDGRDYQPVAGLQGVDFYKKWGLQKLAVAGPFPARYLRLRFHKDGEKFPWVRTPAALYVYDGTADEKIDLPGVGTVIEEKSAKVNVGARDFAVVPLNSSSGLASGAYLFGVESKGPSGIKLAMADYFVMPSGEVKLRPESRFGMNASHPQHIPMLQRLGTGWTRFENMKWRFYNPAPEDFRFDGTVTPWVVPFDEYMKAYNDAGFSVLPYIFQTPDWASTAPPGTQKNVGGYPPKNNEDYGKAIFEAVARYGSKKYPEGELKAKPPASGLNLINTYELWNEPNLNAPGWGFFVGPLEEFFELFRVGAEAAKKADPAAVVSSAGFAGLSMDWLDKNRTYKYADGRTPLDFTDIMNVHFYSGRQEPELATEDPNVHRDGRKSEEIQTYEKNLIDLADWRDDFKPEMPIWLTETGNDVGGPIGRSERYQAAKIPRGLMIALANGVEKIFVYRETGSTPAQHAGAGLLRNDATVRPAFFTMATLTRQLDGAQDVRVPRLDTGNPHIWMYRWKRGGRGDVVTAWTPEGTQKLGLDLGRCKIVDAFGAETEGEVGQDFEVGIFPVYLSQIGNPGVIDDLEKKALAAEAARQARRKVAKTARAYLYDFGSTDQLGIKVIGEPRRFTPVTAEDVYAGGKTFGFTGPVSGKNEVRNHIRSALEKDAVMLHKTATFRVDAEPGNYVLDLKTDYPTPEKIVVRGGKEGDITLTTVENRSLSTPITVEAGAPVQIQFPDKGGKVQWLSLVEAKTP